jgi:hypothetical protein
VADAAQLAMRLRAIDPAVFHRRDGGKEIDDAAVAFEHLTNTVGLSPQEAAQRLIDMRDPEKARERDALMKSDATQKFIKGKATESVVRDIFDPGWFSSDPSLGETPAQAAAMVGDYRDILEESMFDAGGDQGVAEKLAADRFKRLYGVSEFTISGTGVVTRLPPEVAYPAGKDGSHGYIRDQVTAALKEAGIDTDKVYLQADGETERDFNAGKPSRYQVWYEKDGVLERYHLPFYAVAPTQDDLAAAAREKSESRYRDNRAAATGDFTSEDAQTDAYGSVDAPTPPEKFLPDEPEDLRLSAWKEFGQHIREMNREIRMRRDPTLPAASPGGGFQGLDVGSPDDDPISHGVLQ